MKSMLITLRVLFVLGLPSMVLLSACPREVPDPPQEKTNKEEKPPAQVDAGQSSSGADSDAGVPDVPVTEDAGISDVPVISDAGHPENAAPADAGAGAPPGFTLDGGVNPLAEYAPPPQLAISVFNDAGIPELSSETSPTAEVRRDFECDPTQVLGETGIAEVDGAFPDLITIKPYGPACNYHLYYRSAHEGATQLSNTPSGYLIVIAGLFANGNTLVCSSTIQHAQKENALVGQHEIQGVQMQCNYHNGTAWSGMVTVVQGADNWAPWLRELVAVPGEAGTYRITYARDFTFHPMNFIDKGRPATDGLYEVKLSTASGQLQVVSDTKISEKTSPMADRDTIPWQPTAKEKEELSDIFDFTRDPCTEGCSYLDGGLQYRVVDGGFVSP